MVYGIWKFDAIYYEDIEDSFSLIFHGSQGRLILLFSSDKIKEIMEEINGAKKI